MNFSDPFAAMQAAVDIVGQSPHETNKVAATLYGRGFGLSRTNYWPAPILTAFGMGTQIGNSSGTVHAETACILQAGTATDGASLCITDPFCPNCAKNIVEAGIKAIYIDHKGFDKDFFRRRGDHFDTMSMRICEKAGVAVYELWRKDERIVPIYQCPSGYAPPEDSPIHREPIDAASDAVFKDVLADAFRRHEKRKFAAAFMRDHHNNCFAVVARGHAVTGYSMDDPDDIAQIERAEGKYSFFQEPVNRILMYAARYGLTIIDSYFFCSQVPTSREQVNVVGAGIHRLTVGDIRKSRDADAMQAMKQLAKAGILRFT